MNSAPSSHRAVSIQERSEIRKSGPRPKFSNVHDSQGKGLKEILQKGLKIRKGLDFQPARREPLTDWAHSTSNRIEADIEAIRFRSDKEIAMEEDGREGDSPHAFSPSSSGAEPGLVIGNRFTWRGGSLFQCLDRCLVNESWSRRFPFSRVLHLEQVGSNHCPIILEVNSEFRFNSVKPFRYMVAVSFFSALFTSSGVDVDSYGLRGLFPPVGADTRNMLTREVLDTEIKDVLFSMSP
ncbi:hypothetical protein V6N13_125380 [Hibiscus sabdariffa]